MMAALEFDTATLVAIVAAAIAALTSLGKWRSGEKGNVLAQTAAELSSAAGQTVTNLMADNARLRAENAELEAKLDDWEARVSRLTDELSELRSELEQARQARSS